MQVNKNKTMDIQQIVFARIRRKIKQQDFAKMVGISKTYMNLIECGKKEPSLGVLKKICSILELDLTIKELEK